MNWGDFNLPDGRQIQFKELGMMMVAIGQMVIEKNCDPDDLFQNASMEFVACLEEKLRAQSFDEELLVALVNDLKKDLKEKLRAQGFNEELITSMVDDLKKDLEK